MIRNNIITRYIKNYYNDAGENIRSESVTMSLRAGARRENDYENIFLRALYTYIYIINYIESRFVVPTCAR